jgi:phenylalanyl-tRNA synthetase alpha chain
MTNIPESIKKKIGLNLHNKYGHPIKIIKEHIYKYFDKLDIKFDKFENFSPYVDVKYNFDVLRIPKEHPSRKKTDTYYVDDTTVLRTHTSAHQYELLQKGHKNFLVVGDVYRKDEIDARHYPVFHQLEGVFEVKKDAVMELKQLLSGLIEYLFPNCEYRFAKDYFPFTEPSFEIEVMYRDKWLEVLGCGVMHREILDSLNIQEEKIAFGLGIERLCMVFFDIPDIRLLWTDNPKFLDQFKEEKIVKFKPYSNLEPIYKDISFWLPSDQVNIVNSINTDFNWNNINDFYELARESFGDNIESINLYDKFYNNKKNTYSHTFRLTFTPNSDIENPADFTELINKQVDEFRLLITNKLKLILR